jgi:hypothetical protein
MLHFSQLRIQLIEIDRCRNDLAPQGFTQTKPKSVRPPRLSALKQPSTPVTPRLNAEQEKLSDRV